MKIDDISQQINQIKSHETSAYYKAGEEKIESKGTEVNAQPGTKVDISNTSVEVSRTAEMMNRVPDERTQRIAELKAMINSDTYDVDSEKLADKMLSDPIANII